MSLEEEWHQNKGEAFAQGFNGEHPDSDVLPLPPELIVTDEELAMYLNKLCIGDIVYMVLESALDPDKVIKMSEVGKNTYETLRKLTRPPHIMEQVYGQGYRINSNPNARNFILRLSYAIANSVGDTTVENVYGEAPFTRLRLFEAIAQMAEYDHQGNATKTVRTTAKNLATATSISPNTLVPSHIKPLAVAGKLTYSSPKANASDVLYSRKGKLTQEKLIQAFPPPEAYAHSLHPTEEQLFLIYNAIPANDQTTVSEITQKLHSKYPDLSLNSLEIMVIHTLVYWRENTPIVHYEGFTSRERSHVVMTPQQIKFFRDAAYEIRQCQIIMLTEEELTDLEEKARVLLEEWKMQTSEKDNNSKSEEDYTERILSEIGRHPEGILSTDVPVRNRYSARQFTRIIAQLEVKGLISSVSVGQTKLLKLGPNYVPNSFQEDISEASNAIINTSTVEEQSDTPQTVQESEAVVVFDSHTETLNEEEELTETSSSSLKDESQTSAEEDSTPKVTHTRRKIVRGGKRELPVSSRSRPKTKRQRNTEAAQISRPNIIYDRQHEVSEEELTDAEYMQMWLAGDQRGIEGLVNRYSAALFRFIYHSIGDYDIAQDILQHVRIQLFLSAPTLRLDRPLKSWLFQVAQNRCRDELRRKKPIHFSELEEDLEEQEITSPLLNILDTAPLPEEAVERDELHRLLDTAIQTLPFKFRMVVLLRYYGQLTFNEIGEALTMPEATAKTYFQRAKPLLRKALGGKDISSILNGDLDVD